MAVTNNRCIVMNLRENTDIIKDRYIDRVAIEDEYDLSLQLGHPS